MKMRRENHIAQWDKVIIIKDGFYSKDNQQGAIRQKTRNKAYISEILAIASGIPLTNIFKKSARNPQRDVLKNPP